MGSYQTQQMFSTQACAIFLAPGEWIKNRTGADLEVYYFNEHGVLVKTIVHDGEGLRNTLRA